MKEFIIWFVKQRTVGYLFRNWLVTLVEWWGAGVVICLERGADLHMVQLIHCHSLSLASVKSRLVLPFWYRLTRLVPEKGPLNGCVCVWLVNSSSQLAGKRCRRTCDCETNCLNC